MQFQADVSGLSVRLPKTAEATALGAAFLAGLAVGFFRDRDEVREKAGCGAVYEPKMTAEERSALLEGWHRSVAACRAF